MSNAAASPPILRYPGEEHPDLPLHAGMNGLCRDPDLDRGLMLTPGGGSSLIEFCSDARGLWLHVAEGVRGVHVNGRPVQRLARLHVGDAIHCEGVEMQLADARPRDRAAAAPSDAATSGSRLVLRGHGGDVHGQSVALHAPIGIGGEAGLQVEGIARRIGELRPLGEHSAELILQPGAEGCRLNGWPCEAAVLETGDQLVFSPGCRYLVEGPGFDPALPQPQRNRLDELPAASPVRSAFRVPWLLLAAAASALLLAALLWFGVK